MKEFGLRLLDTLSVEISVAVFFGIGVGAVLGTAIVLLMIWVTKWKRRFLEKKEVKTTQFQLPSAKAIQQYKTLLDDGAITQEEYEYLKQLIFSPPHK